MPIQIVSHQLLDELVGKALASARQRINHNFHKDLAENPNRFLNVMVKGTYVTPHRHVDPPKCETFLLLRGSVLFITFEDDGEIASVHRLGDGGEYGIDITPGIWHSLIVTSDTAVCFEIKPGPYAPANDKDFAPWAPRETSFESPLPEGKPECDQYARTLLKRALEFNADA